MTNINFTQKVILLLLAINPALSQAESFGPFSLIEAKAVNEVWLSPGFYSYHFEKDKDLDNNNLGLGFEYRYSTVHSIAGGRFHNSDRQMSNYAAWYWQPLALGSVRLGALIGAIDGYPQTRNGGWFPMAIPVASYEHKNIGISLTLIPTYKDMVHGSLSLQLRFKLF